VFGFEVAVWILDRHLTALYSFSNPNFLTLFIWGAVIANFCAFVAYNFSTYV